MSRHWTAKEYGLLEELWGTKTMPQIAKILGRSTNAIKIKIVRRGLGAFKHRGEYMTARNVSELLGVDIHTVTDYWIAKCGLKAKKLASHGQKRFTYIAYDDLIKWLRKNQDKWDSRRVELYALGCEPDWLTVKRQRDTELPARRWQKWTWEEDWRLVTMYKRGESTDDIATTLDRSKLAVRHRARRLDIWGTGKYVGGAT